MKTTSTIYDPHFSLLWPSGDTSSTPETYYIDTHTYQNLELTYLISEISLSPGYRNDIERTIRNIPVDKDVIEYRQEILEDFMRNPELITYIEEIIPVFDIFSKYKPGKKRDQNAEIFELTSRLSELEGYIFCVGKLHNAFGNLQKDFQSEGMKQFKAFIDEITSDEVFQNLAAELPGLISNIRGMRSITIGVNLNKDLLPVEATLLSINTENFIGAKNLVKQIFRDSVPEYEGIARLHSVPVKEMWARGESLS